MLVEARFLTVEGLERFLEDYLDESGALEAAYCAASCGFGASCQAGPKDLGEWLGWNIELSARKPARESRDASAAMGRRFLRLAASMSGHELLTQALDAISVTETEVHMACCFGFAAGIFGMDAVTASAAYLQQATTALISACQRLLPLGQTQAHQILWNMKPVILATAERGANTPPAEVSCFTPQLDVASARHSTMYTRLFMS